MIRFENIGVPIYPRADPYRSFTNDEFLIIRETLQRIGINEGDATISQIAHILHSRGRYRIVHYKELMMLDGKDVILDDKEADQRDYIARKLEDWGMIAPTGLFRHVPDSSLEIIPFPEKTKWKFITKYTVGKKDSYATLSTHTTARCAHRNQVSQNPR